MYSIADQVKGRKWSFSIVEQQAVVQGRSASRDRSESPVTAVLIPELVESHEIEGMLDQ